MEAGVKAGSAEMGWVVGWEEKSATAVEEAASEAAASEEAGWAAAGLAEEG